MIWVIAYLYCGLAVLLKMAYEAADEHPQAEWWRDWLFFPMSCVVLLAWPYVVYLWVRSGWR